MKPMLDPDRDLKGATPETLARALLRQPNLGPRPAGKAVVGDEVAVEKIATYKPGHRVSRICASVPEPRMLCLPANS